MPRKLRYSERQAIAETGSLGPFSDEPTHELRSAVIYLVTEGETEFSVGEKFKVGLHSAGTKHFGWQLTNTKERLRDETDIGRFLDLLEIIRDEAVKSRIVFRLNQPNTHRAALPNAEDELNDLFDRHRFGYRFEDGELRKIGSPVLDDVVTGPALLASQRSGWEEVERTYKEALHHQRGGDDENDDALTSACAAVEAALKAAGYKGTHLGPLAKSFKESGSVPPELAGVPGALDLLLKRIGAVRNQHSDSHGKHPGAYEVPQALVDLAIHWAGAFIVYLAAEHP